MSASFAQLLKIHKMLLTKVIAHISLVYFLELPPWVMCSCAPLLGLHSNPTSIKIRVRNDTLLENFAILLAQYQ